MSMKVSGFTIVRNASLLEYPFRESVLSVLPLCDEFVINLGDGSDNTGTLCESLQRENPEKIKIIKSVWTTQGQEGGFQLRHQTNRALKECRGDWCFYIQADEAVHESDFTVIRKAMETADQQPEADGLLFDYLHFYGSYDYRIEGRNWYRKEVRLFKNHRGIEAFRDAQGFRKNGEKLKVIPVKASVFHYGYVRTPRSLGIKGSEMDRWWGKEVTSHDVPLHRHVGLSRFKGTHPRVMQPRITSSGIDFHPKCLPWKRDWDELKNAVTFVWEKVFPFRIGEFKNYETI